MGIDIQVGAPHHHVGQQSQGRQDVRFGDLPHEIKIAVIDAEPEAALGLMDTCHEFEKLVVAGPLRPLLEYFSNSTGRLRAFLKSSRQSHKSAVQIVRLAETFSTLSAATPETVRSAAKYLVELGMLTPRIYNAMCPAMLGILCADEVLEFSFTRRFPLLSDGELLDHTSTTSPHARDVTDCHLSELDIVLIRFGRQIGEDNLVRLAIEQVRERNNTTKSLMSLGFKSVSLTSDLACGDAFKLSVMLKRLMSASTLRMVNKNPSAPDGLLYRLAFVDMETPAAKPRHAGRPECHTAVRKNGSHQKARSCGLF